jgi:hypothetical protein
MEKKQKTERIRFLRDTRKELLRKLGMPEDTPASDVQTLLETRQIIDRLNRINRNSEKKD